MKATPTKQPTTVWLPVSALFVDPSVNTRPQKQSKVAQIAQNFDPEALRVIEVAERPRGRFSILDGAHRVAGVRELGWSNGQKIECINHGKISHARECELFRKLNEQQNMAAMPKMLARIGEHAYPDFEINSIVESVGLKLGLQKTDGQICSAHCLYKVFAGARLWKGAEQVRTKGDHEDEPELLRSTLRLILASWGKNKNGLRHDVINGAGLFLARYGTLIDTGALVERLAQSAGGPLGLVADGRALAHLHNSGIDAGIAGKLVFIYNEKRRSKKLPDWWAAS